MVLIEQSIHKGMVEDGSLDEVASIGHIFSESSAQIVKNHHTVSPSNEVFSYVRANEAGAASDE
jgi:hypothetical protein